MNELAKDGVSQPTVSCNSEITRATCRCKSWGILKPLTPNARRILSGHYGEAGAGRRVGREIDGERNQGRGWEKRWRGDAGPLITRLWRSLRMSLRLPVVVLAV